MKTILLSAAIIAAFAPSAKADDITQVLPQVQHQAAPKAPEQPAPPVQHQPEPKHAAPAPAKAPQQAPAAAVPIASSNSTSAAQAQAGAQAASQSRSGVSDSGNSASRAYGGNSRNSQAANGNGANAGAGAGTYAGSNAVTIEGDRTLVLSLPSVPATPPSFVASAHMTMMWSPCGPLVRVVAEAVYGESRGLFGGVTQVYLGANEKTVEHRDHMGEIQPYTAINGHWFGHQVLYSGAVPGVASGTNLTIGGAGAGGGGQAGGGTSGGMQRPVERVQVRLCDLGLVAVAAPHVVYPPRATFVPIKPIVKPRPPCVLEDKTVKVCKRSLA